MNWRMRKIFGSRFSSSRFRINKFHSIGILLILFVGVFGWSLLSSDSSTNENVQLVPQNSLTGAAVVEQQNQEEQEQVVEKQEEKPVKEREFYEYKEECARDMKQRQDDLDDINNQVTEFANRAQELEEEYKKKLQELENEFKVPLDNAKAKSSKAEREVSSIEERWVDRKEFCDRKYPA